MKLFMTQKEKDRIAQREKMIVEMENEEKLKELQGLTEGYRQEAKKYQSNMIEYLKAGNKQDAYIQFQYYYRTNQLYRVASNRALAFKSMSDFVKINDLSAACISSLKNIQEKGFDLNAYYDVLAQNKLMERESAQIDKLLGQMTGTDNDAMMKAFEETVQGLGLASNPAPASMTGMPVVEAPTDGTPALNDMRSQLEALKKQ